jgi:AcrR family transcriptional regulator
MTFTAMARPPTLSDEEIVARARAIFVERGFGARTKQIAAAVGLTWGAIALRFGSKRSLFTRAMAGPVQLSDQADCEQKGWADLTGLLERLRDHLGECWPLRLQVRLAAPAANPCEEPDATVQKLAALLEAHARRGAVRSDINSRVLAQIVLALVTGDVAQRFVAREQTLTQSPAFIHAMVRLLSPQLNLHKERAASAIS